MANPAAGVEIQTMTEEEMADMMKELPQPVPRESLEDKDLSDLVGRITIVDTESPAAALAAKRAASHGHPMIVPEQDGPYRLMPEPKTEDEWHHYLCILHGNTELQCLMNDIGFRMYLAALASRQPEPEDGTERQPIMPTYERLYRYTQDFGPKFEFHNKLESRVRPWPEKTEEFKDGFHSHVRSIGLSPQGYAAALCRSHPEAPMQLAGLNLSPSSSPSSDWKIVKGYEIPLAFGLPKLANIDGCTVAMWWEPANEMHVIHLDDDTVQIVKMESREQGLMLDYVIATKTYAFATGSMCEGCAVPGCMRVINMKGSLTEHGPFLRPKFTAKQVAGSAEDAANLEMSITVVFPNDLNVADNAFTFSAGTDDGLILSGQLPEDPGTGPVNNWVDDSGLSVLNLVKRENTEAKDFVPAQHPLREPITFVALRSLPGSDLTLVASGQHTLAYFSSMANTLNEQEVPVSRRVSLYHDVDRESSVVCAVSVSTALIDLSLNGKLTIHSLRDSACVTRVVCHNEAMLPIEPELACRSLYAFSSVVVAFQPNGDLVFVMPTMEDESPPAQPQPAAAAAAE